MDGDYCRRARALGVKLPEHMSGTLGGNHGDIDIGGGHNLPVVDVKAVGEHEHLALGQTFSHRSVVDIALQVIRCQHNDNIGFLSHIISRHHLKARLMSALPARAALGFGHYYLGAAVPQVLGVGVTLAAVADDADHFAIERFQVAIFIIVYLGHGSTPFI